MLFRSLANSRSLVMARQPANNVRRRRAQQPLHVRRRIVLRTSSWMTKWITSATALTTSARTRTRTRVAVVVLVLRLPAQALQPVRLRPHVLLARVVRAAAAAVQPPARLLPSAVAHAAVLRVMVRRVVTRTRVTVARPAMISQPVKSQPFVAHATASRNRRSCTRSPKAIASRLLSSSISCQPAHAVKNQPC